MAPKQKPGQSKQDYATPIEFLDAVQARFGQIVADLAANKSNAVVDVWLGPGSKTAEDGLTADWDMLPKGLLWLNPPFGDIAPWVERCVEWRTQGCTIAVLVPASIGSEWFRDFVHGSALVLGLGPRMSFDGKAPYPKDLMLLLYGPFVAPGFDCWRWKP